ncbi:UNVERIFIED_CONTAM: hypothetical protein Sangu_3052900 [Sesamum angustifolium]|uniref:Uncharacterized protein n=1 Tax=Sesamum angustifolium TaxID=2727405 RepID=A0AAW2KE49_9LAMI
MNGSVNMNTFKINEKVYGRDIQVLVDRGSTNCFLDEETAYKLGCKQEYTTPMQVSVANGTRIVSDMYCPKFTWRMQDQKFNYPLRVIKLGGCNVVLGGDWLRKHKPVEYNYEDMKVTVARGKRLIVKALTKVNAHHAEFQMISVKSMKRLILRGNYNLMGQLSVVNSEGGNSIRTNTVLEAMLEEFSNDFQELSGLPPKRMIKHLINLYPSAIPKKHAPYRYTHAQKTKI